MDNNTFTFIENVSQYRQCSASVYDKNSELKNKFKKKYIKTEKIKRLTSSTNGTNENNWHIFDLIKKFFEVNGGLNIFFNISHQLNVDDSVMANLFTIVRLRITSV